MTRRIAVVGAGPAGFAVASAFLAEGVRAEIELLDRLPVPDGMLRHGPASGAGRLRDVARLVDEVLGDERVNYYGGIDVGSTVTLAELRHSADAVVLTTGAWEDLPLDVAGRDSVGVGTITHVQAWLAGNADVDISELDLAMDSAVLIGFSPESLAIAQVLAGVMPSGVNADVAERLAGSRLRHVQIVDPRSEHELRLPDRLPANLVVRAELIAVGVVGRNRARAVRCVRAPDSYGRVVTEDLRAQLLLRSRTNECAWAELDADRGHIAHVGSRVLSGGVPAAGLYVAGWAGRRPGDRGSHADDAAAVLAAVRADEAKLAASQESFTIRREAVPAVSGWSAIAATDVLLARFEGEGLAPLANYYALVEQVDED